jgi:phosphate starvation-inducible PhoH-like protein
VKAIGPALEFDNSSYLPLLFGERNSHLKHLEKALSVQIADRGNMLNLSGDDDNVEIAEDVLKWMYKTLQKGRDLGIPEIDAAIRFAKSHSEATHDVQKFSDATIVTRKKTLMPRTQTQSDYIRELRAHEMTFGIGPAGTGKTYLAVAAGVEMYEKQLIERMVFCRPAVEAGEKLGFLPGDMKEKIDPYLRPIYDALFDFLGAEKVTKMMERGEIEIAPLAFMRGRTLANAFVMLDEAQNTTSSQMKMFLSRMGDATRMVITGDPTQIDLPSGQISGLKEAIYILNGIPDISFVEFSNKDVVRHKLVGKILQAYDDNRA